MSGLPPVAEDLAVYQMPTGRRLWAYRRFDGTWGKAPTFARAARYWAYEQQLPERVVEGACDGEWSTGYALGDAWVQICSGCHERMVIINGRGITFPPGTTDAELRESL
jgi:hypothetical protein